MAKLILLAFLILTGCSSVPSNKYADIALSNPEGNISRAHQDDNFIMYYLTSGTDKWLVKALVDPDTETVEILSKEPRMFIDVAEACQWADVTTTAVGIAVFAATEANPIGLATIPLKYVLNVNAEYMDKRSCEITKAALAGFGCGAAAMNVVTIANNELATASWIVGAVVGAPATVVGKRYAGCENWVGDSIKEKEYMF